MHFFFKGLMKKKSFFLPPDFGTLGPLRGIVTSERNKDCSQLLLFSPFL